METNEDQDAPRAPSNRRRSMIATAAVATGLAIGAAGIAGAATGSSSSSSDTSGSSTQAPASAPGYGAPSGTAPSGTAPSDGTRPDPSTMTNGPGETLLTGDAATKAKAAALGAVPGATVIRVETDSGDAEYEAHLKKSDGSFVTVSMDSSFTVTSTTDGFGPGPQGQSGANGQPPAAPGSSSSTSTTGSA